MVGLRCHHRGNEPGANTFTNPYGQLYTPNDGNPQPGALVEVRDLQQWFLNSAGVWSTPYTSPPVLGGALYPENFQGASIGGNLDQESIPGSIVISPGEPGINPALPNQGYLFHVFPDQARAEIPQPPDIKGVVIACRARLVAGSYMTWNAQPPALIYDVGGDYWPSSSGGSSPGIGQSRFKLVKADWRAFIYSTLTSAQIKAIQQGIAAPPPLTNVNEWELY